MISNWNRLQMPIGMICSVKTFKATVSSIKMLFMKNGFTIFKLPCAIFDNLPLIEGGQYLVEVEVLEVNQPTINQYEVLWSTGSDVGIITARTIIVH